MLFMVNKKKEKFKREEKIAKKDKNAKNFFPRTFLLKNAEVSSIPMFGKS